MVAAGHAAVTDGMRVRYLSAAELIESLYRGLADNSVGKIIDSLLRFDLVIVDELGFAPLDDHGTQLLFRFVAAAYERRSLGIASHWPFEQWGRFLPEHTTAASMLDRLLHHAVVVVTEGESFRMMEARSRGGGRRKTATKSWGVGNFSWPPVGTFTWPLTPKGQTAGRPGRSPPPQRRLLVIQTGSRLPVISHKGGLASSQGLLRRIFRAAAAQPQCMDAPTRGLTALRMVQRTR